MKEINLKSSQVINCPISNTNITNTQVIGPESARKYDTDQVLHLSMNVPIPKAPPAKLYNPDKVIDLSMKAPSQTALSATKESPASPYLPPDSTPSPGLSSRLPFTSTPRSPGSPLPTPVSKSPPIFISDEQIPPSSHAPSTNTEATDIYDYDIYICHKRGGNPKGIRVIISQLICLLIWIQKKLMKYLLK